MTSREESPSFRSFFQYVEDSGLRTYDGLVIQNASDIARESNRLRNQSCQSRTCSQEKQQKKRRQDEDTKMATQHVTSTTCGPYTGKQFRMGFMTLPAPQDRLPTSCTGFSVRSQSLHSVGGEEEYSTDTRKQPPPKPKRDPKTKLSSSAETVDGDRRESTRDFPEAKELLEPAEGLPEDSKRLPPPKPKRNPNTQLSTSFDESYMCHHRHRKSSIRRDKPSSLSPSLRDTDDEEPVYIEMVGNILRELEGHNVVEDQQSESVYEEMKFPILEDFLHDGHTAVMDSEVWMCDIPPPFPNLLTPRPPLLVFPPAPAQCSPNSDESPLTPLDVTQLPMFEEVPFNKSGHHRKDRESNRDHTVTSSGRSSAPPLPSNFYNTSSSSHSVHTCRRSQSACPSPVSVARSLTPLSLKRPPPYDCVSAGASMPYSSSSSLSQRSSCSSTHGSMQNICSCSQTPTSPLEELNHFFTSGRRMTKKGSGRRKSSDGGGDCTPQHRAEGAAGDVLWSPAPSRKGRSSVSPTMMLCGGAAGAEPKPVVCKLGRSASTSGVQSPAGTPQRHLHDTHQHVLSQMPWLCRDSTMMEIIEKKRVLCREIQSRQWLEKNLSKQENMSSILPSWKKKQPPPYSAPPEAAGHSAAVFWDTAI